MFRWLMTPREYLHFRVWDHKMHTLILAQGRYISLKNGIKPLLQKKKKTKAKKKSVLIARIYVYSSTAACIIYEILPPNKILRRVRNHYWWVYWIDLIPHFFKSFTEYWKFSHISPISRILKNNFTQVSHSIWIFHP